MGEAFKFRAVAEEATKMGRKFALLRPVYGFQTLEFGQLISLGKESMDHLHFDTKLGWSRYVEKNAMYHELERMWIVSW